MISYVQGAMVYWKGFIYRFGGFWSNKTFEQKGQSAKRENY